MQKIGDEQAKQSVFTQLTDSWLNKDLAKFLSCFSEKISYTECYGAQYKGKSECEQWFRHWTNPVENVVKSWTVENSYFTDDIGFFTWTFHCVYDCEEAIFDGISLVKFSSGLISEIQEFEQKHIKFSPYSSH